MNAVIVMLGGVGQRFGAPIPKQFSMINGHPLYLPILSHYARLDSIDLICVVCHREWIDKVKQWDEGIPKKVIHTVGGSTRSHSVKNGIEAIKPYCSSDDVVLIHDSTHPYLDTPAVEKIIHAVKEYGAATLATYGYDTVYQLDNSQDFLADVLPRQYVVNGASPEAFKFSVIAPIYENASEESLNSMTSAGAIVLDKGISMKFIHTDILNLKITFQRDFELFTLLGEEYFYR